VDKETFIKQTKALGYPGDAEKVFFSIADDKGHVNRKAFQGQLRAAAGLGSRFQDVVRKAAEANKKLKEKEAAAASEAQHLADSPKSRSKRKA